MSLLDTIYDNRRSCATCTYWDECDETGLGTCHRYPPQGEGRCGFPVTSPSDYCYEFAPLPLTGSADLSDD